MGRFRIAHFAIAVAFAASVTATGCSGDDDTPADPSVLAAVEAALCEDFGPVGSFPLNGRIYDMSDCPP